MTPLERLIWQPIGNLVAAVLFALDAAQDRIRTRWSS